MSSESKRGCGYRKIGALYVEGTLIAASCPKLPYRLKPCPVCSMGIKQARGWTWIDPSQYFKDIREGKARCKNYIDPATCKLGCQCPFNPPHREMQRGDAVDYTNTVALLWVGKKYYTVKTFEKEALAMGVSKRINSIPEQLQLGQTWILLCHPEAVTLTGTDPEYKGKGSMAAGIFRMLKPDHIAMPMYESQASDDFKDWLLSFKGIKVVPIKDGDKAHAPDPSGKRRIAGLLKEYERFKNNLDHWQQGGDIDAEKA